MKISLTDLLYSFIFFLMLSTYVLNSTIVGWFAVTISIFLWMRNLFRPQNLILLQIIYIFQYQFYISKLGMPAFISYFTDVITFTIILHLAYSALTKKQQVHRSVLLCFVSMIIFFCIGLLSNVGYGANLLLYLWSVRNVARIPIFLIACIYYSDVFLLTIGYRMMKIAFFFNGIFIGIQYGLFGYYRDFLGGIFGNQMGTANTYLHVLLIVVACFVIPRYMNGTITLFSFIYYLLVICMVSAISELKIIFVELPILFMVTYITQHQNSEKNAKLLSTLILSPLLFAIALTILGDISPFFRDFFSFNKLLSISTSSYTGVGDISRLAGISYVIENMFDYDILLSIFGIGLGNAEFSSTFAILRSPFYERFGLWSHYDWFSLSFTFIETGFLGLIFYLLPYVYIAKSFIFQKIKSDEMMTTLLITIVIFILFIYNTTLRTEAGYVIVFVLSLGYANFRNSLVSFQE